MLRHDVRTDDFPEGSFDLVHVRAVLIHIPGRMATLPRIASWLAPGGWLVAEEPDFGMWLADLDPTWAAHLAAWHEAFPTGSLSQGRALLRQIHRLGLAAARYPPYLHPPVTASVRFGVYVVVFAVAWAR